MNQVFARLQEPSTMAGLSVLLGLFGVPHAPEAIHGVASVATGLFGLLAIIKPEAVAK
jgi:hypothetical protein